jgi:formiminotetrahydrofolate cyclodeaminase
MSNSNDADVQQLTVAEVLEAVGAARPTSGAGVAAALALALAAACARKAVGVTRNHRDGEELRPIGERLAALEALAVEHARRDQLVFAEYLKTKEPKAAQHLVDSSGLFQQLLVDLGREIERLPDLVADNVAGDISAARSLHRAAAEISADLLRGARAERSRVVP